MNKILVIGSSGQLGTELVLGLQNSFKPDQVIASDIRKPIDSKDVLFEELNVLDKSRLFDIVRKHKISTVYLLAAVLSATGEKNPGLAWDLNMNGLSNILDLARDGHIKKIYWPSSIAIFGPNTPKTNTPQNTITDPTTVYGITKLAGERWSEYYHKKHGVDIRSLRFPGLIGYKSLGGGGTTDYAVDIYHEAIKNKKFECFLKEDTCLPMMYMPDAIKATIDIMEASASSISVRSSYNISAISFTPKEIAASIKKHIPEFEISYKPDFRQAIAETWPSTIDDSRAREDWGWKHEYSLEAMTADILQHLKKQ